MAGWVALERQILHVTPGADLARFKGAADFWIQESFTSYFGAPLIAKGQIQGVLEIYHRTSFEPDQDWLNFFEALAGQAAIAIDSATLFADLQRANTELLLAYDTTLEGWVHALDLRDQETEGHTQRVATMTLRLARSIGVNDEALAHIRRGAMLHDIGKMAVSDYILRKPGSLSEEELRIVRKHPVHAYELLSPVPFLAAALDIPYCHHEKWDGTGYPRGLKGEQIPLAARIFAVVDVWDAITNDRIYRKGWDIPKAIDYLRFCSGSHFDPRVVEVFLNLFESNSII
jgi:putative nucleotidyltransferase with HDIG domain